MFNPLNLAGRTILVTGASSGIGAHTAKYLSRLGAKLIISARDTQRLDAVLEALEPGDHVAAPIDLAAEEDISRWMMELATKTGPIHGMVHSAGISGPKPLRSLSPSDFQAMMNVNVRAAIALAKGFRQKTVFAPGGGIIFLSSVAGLAGQPANVLYSATKGALIAMTRSLALELAREDIRVNCIAPAMVMTEMGEKIRRSLPADRWQAVVDAHPLGTGEPEDVAGAVAFLLAQTGRWITGTTLVIDGGYTAG